MSTELPPIESLPPEILCEIFLLAIKRPYKIFGDQYQGPWLPARVCRRWRDIAWDCPALWSSIMVYWPEHGKADAGKKLLLDALQRTGRTRISITILLSLDFPHAIIEGLVQHSSQWEDVRMPSLPASTWTQLAQPHLSRLHLPSLRSLALGRQPSVDELSTIPNMFKDMPALRSFQFHIYRAPSSNFDPSIIQVPWWQLTHLAMSLGPTRECSVDASIKVLSLCLSLETLREETMFNDDPGTTLVTLGRLRSLSVRSPELLYCLVCPVLEDLTVLPRHDRSFSIPKVLSQIVVQSGCRLLSLDIWLSYQLEEPIKLFSCVPHICKLVLRAECYDLNDMPSLLKCLALDDTSVTLPNLEFFELEIPELFTGAGLSEEVDELLVKIIDRRWNVLQESPVSRLRQVRIRCSTVGIGGAIGIENQGDQAARNHRTIPHVDRLKSLKAEGLDISIVFEQENGLDGMSRDCIFL
ncbi:hypothetical protein IW261DRAFT_1420812 [Armillaria novae-zelandiae]|uniref:F-box domain-containing protein n=1 Tax=Armillaria novae-zelandiae TaxID=153914 RepID=A0AA39P5I1_9AGAR|nr:hypothetical protein IW261DRAFT_1420812 [Armillaria novae-zelandiae]